VAAGQRLQQYADAAIALEGRRAQAVGEKAELLVLGADAPCLAGLFAGSQIISELLATADRRAFGGTGYGHGIASQGKPTLWGRRKATKRGVVERGVGRPIGPIRAGSRHELGQCGVQSKTAAGGRRFAAAGFRIPRIPNSLYQRFIELKNSSLDLVFFILSSMNSIALNSSIGCSSLRRVQILASLSGSISRSSRRVPERLMSMAG